MTAGGHTAAAAAAAPVVGPGAGRGGRGQISRQQPPADAAAAAAAHHPGQGSCPGRRFPANCLKLVRSLPGNSRCVDCEEMNPEWSSVSYGVLLCLRCSGRHRGLGVNNSVVKSIAMDGWSHTQIISLLEGGNDQLSGFFVRHSLSPKSAAASSTGSGFGGGSGSGNSSGDEDSDVIVAKAAAAAAKAAAALTANQKPVAPSRSNSFSTVEEIVALRYKTKAALFYRENLAKHVERVAADGRYRGREAARKRATGGGNKSGGTSPNERKSKNPKASPSQPSPGLPPVSASSAVANGAR
mmetsp:Transcript_29060/g.84459  ORF Transcript_29060/g.84459 Transcript_29060/m.84459 type:complete len:298 (-) Transcript_29060:1004-1897(-)